MARKKFPFFFLFLSVVSDTVSFPLVQPPPNTGGGAWVFSSSSSLLTYTHSQSIVLFLLRWRTRRTPMMMTGWRRHACWALKQPTLFVCVQQDNNSTAGGEGGMNEWNSDLCLSLKKEDKKRRKCFFHFLFLAPPAVPFDFLHLLRDFSHTFFYLITSYVTYSQFEGDWTLLITQLGGEPQARISRE